MKSRVLGLTLVAILLVGLGGAILSGHLNSAGDFTRWLAAPLEERLSHTGKAFRERLERPSDIDSLRQENERLRREIERLQVAQVQLAEVEKENERLRALLNFAQAHPTYQIRGAGVVGMVIGRDPSVIDRILLNVGELDGIRPGMPVVTNTGLVGRILSVHKTTSVVLPITDPESAVSAIVQSSRLTGIVRGQQRPTLLMRYIPLDTPVQVGDLVLTGGLGSVFPPKIVIGQVVSVQRHDYDLFQQAEIRPTVDFRRLEEVLVLTHFSPNQEIRDVLEELGGGEKGP